MPKKYGVFDEHDDSFVSIGTFDSDQDANIAISEHGLDMELGAEYYVARIEIVQLHNNVIAYEPMTEEE